MPVGDAIISVNSVPAGSTLDFQPPSGDEYVIFGVCSTRWIGVTPNQSFNCYVDWFDVGYCSIATANNNPSYFRDMKVVVSNVKRLRITNPAGAVAIIGYWGFQTKD